MTDQPVTPDREALVRCAAEALSYQCGGGHGYEDEAQIAVDALAGRFLPWFTDALDRARQQGEQEGEMHVLDAIEREMTNGDGKVSVAKVCARLVRGGPNRKDEK